MAGVELVIKIQEHDKAIIDRFVNGEGFEVLPTPIVNKVIRAVRNGIPLPKGHGDIIDRDAINSRYYDIWKELESYSNKPTYKELLDKWSMCMDSAPPIIEADNEESEE